MGRETVVPRDATHTHILVRFHYKIHFGNTEHIQPHKHFDNLNYMLIHFRWGRVLQFKNQFIHLPLFKLVFPIFVHGIIIFSAYLQHSLENATFGGISVLLTCFNIWLLIHEFILSLLVFRVNISSWTY